MDKTAVSLRSFLRLLPLVWIMSRHAALAQVHNPALPDTSLGGKVENLRIAAYLDLYAGSFQPSASQKEVPFFVNMNQNRQLGINLAFIDLRYQKNRIRSRLIPGFGTYINANYAAEPGSLAYLVEANAGYCLSPAKDVWIDAGILSSPYSNESCISKDHLMLSRSFAPEFVPYYLSGIRLSLPLRKNLNLFLFLLNGWQQILDRNSRPAAGTQLEWRPGAKSLLNWNTYAGDERNETPDLQGNSQRMRWFTDLYWVFNPDGKLSATACAYLGLQQYTAGFHRQQSWWWQINAQFRVRMTNRQSLSARLEYFHDPNAAMVRSGSAESGFRCSSAGFCWNVKAAENALFRLEARQFLGMDRLFGNENQEKTASWFLAGYSIGF